MRLDDEIVGERVAVFAITSATTTGRAPIWLSTKMRPSRVPSSHLNRVRLLPCLKSADSITATHAARRGDWFRFLRLQAKD
jgi:hypothetical protein